MPVDQFAARERRVAGRQAPTRRARGYIKGLFGAVAAFCDGLSVDMKASRVLDARLLTYMNRIYFSCRQETDPAAAGRDLRAAGA